MHFSHEGAINAGKERKWEAKGRTLLLGRDEELHSDEGEALALEAANDFANQTTVGGVGLAADESGLILGAGSAVNLRLVSH